MSTPQEDRYLQPHQARERAPTPYEDLLGDAIERAFASGVTQVEDLVAALNRTGPAAPNSQPWTVESYRQEMARLGY
ncbi:MAG: hypothetical protein KA795_07150 [Burkholderiaceae bacterium]|nr:hypothetical protein [Burkholderiaceae bacterium]